MEFDVIKVTFHMTKKTLEFAFMYSNSSSTQVLNVGELKKASVLVPDKKPAFFEKNRFTGFYIFIVGHGQNIPKIPQNCILTTPCLKNSTSTSCATPLILRKIEGSFFFGLSPNYYVTTGRKIIKCLIGVGTVC